MIKFKSLFIPMVVAAMTPMFTACNDDDFAETIFPDVPTVADPSSKTYQFDTWLNRNFRDVYNLDFKYKMADVEADKNYNLVPADYQKAVDLALLVKYTWFDAYKAVCGELLLKQNGPRMLHLIGSSAHNATEGTEVLGLAEGGIKITLFKVNSMNLNDSYRMNEYYFRTMHHELTHILHQKKSYPTRFNELSNGKYDASNWGSRNAGLCTSLGFITNYASSEYREDFAETVANYVTRTPEDYDLLLWCADRGWYSGDDELDQTSAYCYYYYANTSAKENDKRTYTLQYVSLGDGHVSLMDNTGRVYNKIEDINNYIERLKLQLGEDMVFEVVDEDKVDGRAIILDKLKIARDWLLEQWNVDLDKLREEVQKRQNNFDITELRGQITDIE